MHMDLLHLHPGFFCVNLARRIHQTKMTLRRLHLGSGLIDHSQKMTVAAIQIADKNV